MTGGVRPRLLKFAGVNALPQEDPPMCAATRRWLCTTVLATTVLLAGPAQAAELLAVLELSGALPDDQRRALTNAVRKSATDAVSPMDIKVMTRENMETLLTDMGVDASCISEGACEVDTLRNLQANYGVTGEVTDFGGNYLITLQLYEMRGGTLMGSEQAKGTDPFVLATETVPVATAALMARLASDSGDTAVTGAGGAASASPVAVKRRRMEESRMVGDSAAPVPDEAGSVAVTGASDAVETGARAAGAPVGLKRSAQDDSGVVYGVGLLATGASARLGWEWGRASFLRAAGLRTAVFWGGEKPDSPFEFAQEPGLLAALYADVGVSERWELALTAGLGFGIGVQYDPPSPFQLQLGWLTGRDVSKDINKWDERRHMPELGAEWIW